MTENRSYFTPDHDIFRESVKNFVQKELAPLAPTWEKNKEVPREIFQKLADQGFFGINYDPKYGGAGCDFWYKVAFCEEMVKTRANGFVMDVMVHTDMTTPALNRLGTEEQKQEFLVPAIKGEKIAALGVTEPSAGSDVAHIRTTAVKSGNDYIINGAKTYITNGSRADFILLAVRTGGPITKENWATAHEGISFILFPTKDEKGNLTPGFKIGRKLEKLGNRSSNTVELSFENCRVPQKNLLGEENMGFYYIMTNFQGERLIAAIMSVAGMKMMLDDAIKFGQTREAFGRPIITFQTWRHRFAELATEVEAAQELTYRACDLHNQEIPCLKEISMAKLYSTELANKVAYECLQFHGGAGYMEEYDISRMYRDVRLYNIGAGTSEIMKEIISKCMEI